MQNKLQLQKKFNFFEKPKKPSFIAQTRLKMYEKWGGCNFYEKIGLAVCPILFISFLSYIINRKDFIEAGAVVISMIFLLIISEISKHSFNNIVFSLFKSLDKNQKEKKRKG